MNLRVGDEIWNNGDMANEAHFGRIVKIEGSGVYIECFEGSYAVTKSAFSEEYLGHSGTRFVLASEYRRWRQARMARLAGG